MKQNYLLDEWRILEEGFDPAINRISESVFSIGNGSMGQRANFEERYTGDTLQGSYIAGIYYLDVENRQSRHGYYNEKILNAPNWIGIDVECNGTVLDLATCHIESFQRVLNMKEGFLERTFTCVLEGNKRLKVSAKRFCSIVSEELGAIRYSITPLNFNGTLTLIPYLDADIRNENAEHDEKYWEQLESKVKRRSGYLLAETKNTHFRVCTGMKFSLYQDGVELDFDSFRIKNEKYIACSVDIPVRAGSETVVFKYGAYVSSENHPRESLLLRCQEIIKRAYRTGFDQLLQEHAAAWSKKWQVSDIVIKGDSAAQQGIRFNIFQLYQSYNGKDERLNIGPKGFTGEKYGGSTHWDTEAYCLPFFMATAEQRVSRNLLLYRYKHLHKAIENAQKLGFSNGAALYPMVTMTGEENNLEWQTANEAVHRNAVMAFAIFDYVRYTGDESYIADYGLEVMIGICRFWTQRFHWSARKQQFVMHGVTGPNEYENNVNNNWYTSRMARWCLETCLGWLHQVKTGHPAAFDRVVHHTAFDVEKETAAWEKLIGNIFLPYDEALGILLQQDDFQDKEQQLVADLPPDQLPLHQHWSWDRILRSNFLKQADVLQGMYFLEEHFSKAEIERNFDFYEPRTVHESSLSPCLHAILAAHIGKKDKAYELYLRTSRLDLDNYNNDTRDGLHITSMAGTWMAVVQGFGGLKVREGKLHISPMLPGKWESLSFQVRFRDHLLEILVMPGHVIVSNLVDQPIGLQVYGRTHQLKPAQTLKIKAG